MKVLLPFACAGLVACAQAGAEGDGDEVSIDARRADSTDAFEVSPADAASNCLPQVKPSHTGPAASGNHSVFPGHRTYFGEIVDEPFQRLFISLHAETGVFPGPITTGTFNLEGTETDYQFCGACVYLAVESEEGPSTLYMAESGVLTIDSLGSEFHGELSEAVLREIDIAFVGESCGGGGPFPCVNTGCSGGSCGVQVEGPECRTSFNAFTF